MTTCLTNMLGEIIGIIVCVILVIFFIGLCIIGIASKIYKFKRNYAMANTLENMVNIIGVFLLIFTMISLFVAWLLDPSSISFSGGN